MLIHFYLFSSIFVYFGRFLSICNRFHPFPPHYRFLHDQVWRNGLPTLLKSLIRTVWAYSESQTAQILDWGYLRKNSFFAQNGRITIFQWPKVVSEVIFPRFWGGSLCWKVFSEFWNCDQKCRFWGIAISHHPWRSRCTWDAWPWHWCPPILLVNLGCFPGIVSWKAVSSPVCCSDPVPAVLGVPRRWCWHTF